MTENSKLLQAVLRLALIIGIVVVLYYGQPLLLTLTIAGLLAMLLDPVDRRLRNWGWHKYLAISGAMSLLLVFFAAIFFVVGQQGVRFADNLPTIERRVNEQVVKFKQMLPYGSEGMVADSTAAAGGQDASAGGSSGSELSVDRAQVKSFVGTSLGVLGDFLLTLVYVVILLAQKERLREFVLRRTPDDQRGVTHRTINESVGVAQSYLRGRLILIAILAACYVVGFTVAGLEYPIVIAVLAAILSVIPYIGNFVGFLLAFAVVLAGGGGTTTLIWVAVTMSVAQTVESYILTPLVMQDQVDINPLTTILAIVGFAVVWGPAGAIVAIPILAIVRIICSHVEGLEDYAYLLGGEE